MKINETELWNKISLEMGQIGIPYSIIRKVLVFRPIDPRYEVTYNEENFENGNHLHYVK